MTSTTATIDVQKGGRVANGNGGNGSRLVTWPQLISSLGVLGAIGGGVMTFVWSRHAQHPHSGAVHQRELKQFEARYTESLERHAKDTQRVEHKVDKIDDKLDRLFEEVRKR